MKLIESPQKTVEKDRIQMAADQIGQLFKFSKTDEHAEDATVARFVRGLDNRFIMLRNMQLEHMGEKFPPILVGPSGLVVLNLSQAKGFFRAKDESWWEMNKTNHQFALGRPNLIKQSKDYAQRLGEIMDAHGKSHPEILPILIFANPGVHVETSTPAIRIVLMDGIDSLIDSLLNSAEVLQPTEINYLADSLEIMANPEKAMPMGEGEAFFGRDLYIPKKKAPLKLPDVPIPTNLSLPPVEEKLRFSQKQWILLTVLLVLTIVVLFGAILFALRIL